jgi:hypothetical protein
MDVLYRDVLKDDDGLNYVDHVQSDVTLHYLSSIFSKVLKNRRIDQKY